MRPTALTHLHFRRYQRTGPGRLRLRPDAGAASPTMADFVQRAATTAAQRNTPVLELGLEAEGYGRHFDAGRYRWLGLPTPAGARRPSQAPLPVDDEQFGLALCTGAVAASPEPQGLLTELNRTLEPTGVLFLATPLMVHTGGETGAGRRAGVGLNFLLEASGFVIQELQPLSGSGSYGVVAAKRHRPGHYRHPGPLAAISNG